MYYNVFSCSALRGPGTQKARDDGAAYRAGKSHVISCMTQKPNHVSYITFLLLILRYCPTMMWARCHHALGVDNLVAYCTWIQSDVVAE